MMAEIIPQQRELVWMAQMLGGELLAWLAQVEQHLPCNLRWPPVASEQILQSWVETAGENIIVLVRTYFLPVQQCLTKCRYRLLSTTGLAVLL